MYSWHHDKHALITSLTPCTEDIGSSGGRLTGLLPLTSAPAIPMDATDPQTFAERPPGSADALVEQVTDRSLSAAANRQEDFSDLWSRVMRRWLKGGLNAEIAQLPTDCRGERAQSELSRAR
jgi:hypothetical protein